MPSQQDISQQKIGQYAHFNDEHPWRSLFDGARIALEQRRKQEQQDKFIVPNNADAIGGMQHDHGEQID